MATTKTAGKKRASRVVGPVSGKVRRVKSGQTGMIRARIDPALKVQVESIFDAVGLNASEAIRLFYRQVALHQGLPFEVKVPNALTRKAIRDADAGKVTRYSSPEEMFEKTGI